MIVLSCDCLLSSFDCLLVCGCLVLWLRNDALYLGRKSISFSEGKKRRKKGRRHFSGHEFQAILNPKPVTHLYPNPRQIQKQNSEKGGYQLKPKPKLPKPNFQNQTQTQPPNPNTNPNTNPLPNPSPNKTKTKQRKGVISNTEM